MKLLSVVLPCYNEEENIPIIYFELKNLLSTYKNYNYEIIFIDNASDDKTVYEIKKICKIDKNVKLIVNTKNFGQSRSPFYAMMQSKGDAVISMVSDLQMPVQTLIEFIKYWEKGYKIILGVRNKNKISLIRKLVNYFYYKIMSFLTEKNHLSNFAGFALYDKSIVNIMKNLNVGVPYIRSIIHEIGYEKKIIKYNEPKRIKGVTKNNFFSLLSIAINGIANHSRYPLRIMTLIGVISSILTLMVATYYLIMKLIFWDSFQLGLAPMIIGLYLIASILLFSLGMIGEYISVIIDLNKKDPLVYEKERINFD